MTLLNTIRRPDRMLVISDGAIIDDETNLIGLISKVVLIPSANAVVACRGDMYIASMVANGLAGDCAKFRTFDGLKAYALGALRSTFDMFGELCGSFNIDLVVAGWSETHGPESFLIRTLEGTDLPTWQIVELGDGILMPSNQDIFREVGDELANQANELTDQDLIEVAELQRTHIEPHGSKQIPTSWVGGFLQLTTSQSARLQLGLFTDGTTMSGD